MGLREANFEGAQIGGVSSEIVVDGWDADAGVDCSAVVLEAEVQVLGVINGVAPGWGGRDHLFKDVEVEYQAVLFLARGCSEFTQRRKRLPVFGTGFVHRGAISWCEPAILLGDALVGAETVVVRTVGFGCIRPSHHTSIGRIASQEEVVAEVHVRRGVARTLFTNDGVVVDEQSGSFGRELEGDAAGDVV